MPGGTEKECGMPHRPHAPHQVHAAHAVHATSHSVSHLQRWQRRCLYGVVATLALSGVLWLGLHYTVGAGAGELPHPLEAWAMRLHGLGAFGALFMLGIVAGVHVPRGWRMSARRRWAHQRPLGVMLGVLAGLLVLSAYALYYLLPERWHEPVGWGHACVGLLLAGVLWMHARDH